MKYLKRLYFKWFPHFRETDTHAVPYSVADDMLKKNEGWVLSKLEDTNEDYRRVYLCKKIRVTE